MQTPLAIYLDLLHRLVCVGPGGNLQYMFYYDAAYIILKHFYANTSSYLPRIIAIPTNNVAAECQKHFLPPGEHFRRYNEEKPQVCLAEVFQIDK